MNLLVTAREPVRIRHAIDDHLGKIIEIRFGYHWHDAQCLVLLWFALAPREHKLHLDFSWSLERTLGCMAKQQCQQGFLGFCSRAVGCLAHERRTILASKYHGASLMRCLGRYAWYEYLVLHRFPPKYGLPCPSAIKVSCTLVSPSDSVNNTPRHLPYLPTPND